MRRHRRLSIFTVLALLFGLVGLTVPAALAAGTPEGAVPAADAAPAAEVVPAADGDVFRVPGSFGTYIGCDNWANTCNGGLLTLDAASGLYMATFDGIPANAPDAPYEFKVSRNGSWANADVWGAWGQQPGENIRFSTDGSTVYVFFDPATGWAFASNASKLYTVAGSFQSEVGCPDDWQADCLATVMFPQQNGTYRYQTKRIPFGSYEFKVAAGLSWGTSWGEGGGSANIAFGTNANELVVVDFDPATNIPTIDVTNPPVPGTGQQRAIWLDATTIAWPTSLAPAADAFTFVDHPEIAVVPVTLTTEQTDRDWRTRSGFRGLELRDAETNEPLARSAVVELLEGSIQIEASAAGVPAARTGAQLAPVLDDVYAGATDEPLGIVWDGEQVHLRVWAPTATDVSLQLWTGTEVDGLGTITGAPAVVPATRDDNGIWTVTGNAAAWVDAQYLWQVDVFVPSVGNVVRNIVTDPYSVGLTVDSTRSVVVDLDDPQWAPEGWDTTGVAPLRSDAEHSIYELHVRDFSIWDTTVPEALRGTYMAFTVDDSAGVNHLRELSEAGLTTVHLLPTFDIASTTIPEDRTKQLEPDVPDAAPDSPLQQAAVSAVTNRDGFNWGYDPFHWTTPEGSYATDGNQAGGDRTREYREMVAALHDLDLQVVQDVVYNHTAASGQSDSAVLDRIVPGYYQRLNDVGGVENSTCCSNTATENAMAEKMMVESLVTLARTYKVDGFRFDLMGHHSLDNMVAVRAALDALTLEDDGVDGSQIYLYGEGWNFGEVANNARFIQATQGNIAGSGIGAFNDRLRDAVRGGGPFDNDQRTYQGFGSGQYTDPNETAAEDLTSDEQLTSLLHNTDLVRIGLAGSLEDFELLTSTGQVMLASEVDYNGQGAGYTQSPFEAVNYVEAHDNETLFDNGIWKLPTDASMDTRVRSQALSNATVLLGQSPVLLHAGTDLLRSKSLDRDSYNSGDWFNAMDWTGQRSTFGTGLPIQEKNGEKWDLMRPLLADASNRPDADAMAESSALTLDLLRIRSSTPLFTLGDAELIKERVTFPNAGPEATPGLLVMVIDDAAEPPVTPVAARALAAAAASTDLDPELDGVVVVFNASPEPITEAIDGMAGRELALHPVQAEGADDVVKTSVWDAETGTATVPGWTTAVFVAVAEVEPTPEPTTPTPEPTEPTTAPTGPTTAPTTTPAPTATTPGPGGGLPDTGANVGLLVALAGGLLGLGALLQVRRRRAAA